MFDANFGWALRIFHFNGASMFFVFLYLHMFKGLLHRSPRLSHTWISGLSIFILVMGAAFLGYVLVWAQISFWACNVITNLVSVIPYVGLDLIQWVWGGYSVGNATLGLFFVLHFLLPFVIAGVVVIHLLTLHASGSSSPLLTHHSSSKVDFHPSYTSKDSLNLMPWVIFISLALLFPFVLGDPEIFIEANPLLSPVHIVPEWYFLYVYAILRSIPNKSLGVIALVFSFAFLYILSISSLTDHAGFDILHHVLIITFLSVCLVLTWIGSCPVEDPFVAIGLMFTILYFLTLRISILSDLATHVLFH